MSENHTVACVIARTNSTRLPNKAFADLCGKPMTERLIERLRNVPGVDRVAVCTSRHPDDQQLVELARRTGVSAVAGSELDVLGRLIDAADEFQATAVIRVTGDNVFVDPVSLERMITHHYAADADYTRTNGLPLGGTAEVMATRMLRPLHALIPPDQSEYMVLWAFDPERFRCQVLDAPEDVQRPTYSLSIDTPADLALARRLFQQLATTDAGPSLADIVRHLDADPEYSGVPLSAEIKLPEGKTTTFGEILESWTKLAERSRMNRPT